MGAQKSNKNKKNRFPHHQMWESQNSMDDSKKIEFLKKVISQKIIKNKKSAKKAAIVIEQWLKQED